MTRHLTLLLLLVLTTPALAGAVRCTISEVKSLGRLQTLCADGTRATHTWNKTLSRWESTVTPPPTADRPQIHPPTKALRR
jgi:hypothetical protein